MEGRTVVKEEVFWRNYFYRVSLIKQSAQLTALAAQQQAVGKEDNKGREEDSQLTDNYWRLSEGTKEVCPRAANKKSEAAVPPWVDSNEEETIQQQILALSADKRNFLRDPPAGVQFNFDFDQMYPVAMVMLQEDQLLNRMRFDLVPKQ
ncbi:synapse-associated protein 1-like [Meleagris gallopavo]|uniref:synapse-associated protein 1-like n=1 Tax=Meleagris gallopavo TaxID=9103 RepID=UPI0012ABFF54|nr:synapse-associated protein 1-like [Meleagris gallopavo]